MGKKGGSQLSQLRTGLRDAGVTASKPNKGHKDEKDGRVGQHRAAQRRKRLDALMGSLNSFDVRQSNEKSEVIGAKTKGVVGRPSATKSGAVKVRKEQLLPELEAQHRSGRFVDRRFGEHDASMSLEDKMLQRFTHERQSRTGKASLFDLNDDADDGLTHFGHSLSGLDQVPDVYPDEDDGALARRH